MGIVTFDHVFSSCRNQGSDRPQEDFVKTLEERNARLYARIVHLEAENAELKGKNLVLKHQIDAVERRVSIALSSLHPFQKHF